MVKVVYVEHSGEETELQVQEGWSLMQAAVAHGVEGIEAECGGSCCCATCHCYVDNDYLEKLEAPNDNELAMLDYSVAERKPNSRLACQVKVTPEMDGIVVQLPEAQS